MADPTRAAPLRITVSKDGPYAVTGQIPLSMAVIGADPAGESVTWVEGEAVAAPARYFLCRCGQSKTKPFCDGTHAAVGFDGTETADIAIFAETAKETDGPVLALVDAEPLCAFARYCDREGKVWNTVETANSPEAAERFVHQVGQCPSGRLVARDRQTGQALEPDLPVSIWLVEDPEQKVSGPIFARGGIAVVSADGRAYEVRNRVTLCRCGASKNKPFCDGSHASVGFVDA